MAKGQHLRSYTLRTMPVLIFSPVSNLEDHPLCANLNMSRDIFSPFAGFCCNRYSVCADDRSYTLYNFAAAAPMAMIGSLCTEDWIEIAGSSETCGGPVVTNKYCGDFLSTDIATAAANSIICGKIHTHKYF